MKTTGLTTSLILLASAILLLVQPAPVLAQEADNAVAAFIDRWIGAWQAQDTAAYFSSYHPRFSPSTTPDIDAWRQSRTRNITRPARIALSRDNLAVTQEGAELRVRFNLLYRSPDYADNTLKELVLVFENGAVEGIVEELNIAVEPLPDQVLPVEAPVLSGAAPAGQPVTEPAPQPVAGPAPQTIPQAAEPARPIQPSLPAVPAPVPAQTGDVANWVPPGFENLNQPQVTEIDVYYGGYYLTSVLAEFTDQQVTVLETGKLVEQVGNIKNVDAFLALMNEPLDAHVDLVCFSEFQSDCGTLDTESVDIIFDKALLRMWLFIAPGMLQDAGSDVLRFLPPSAAGLSFMNQSALYFTTDSLSFDTYNFFNNTLFAWGENRLSMRSNLVSDKGFDVDTLAFFREYAGRDYRLGLVREDANGFSFMNNERFVGASYASSLLTRADLERSLGTEIELYFPTRSRVEIYREGRLISSSYYNVGNQLLDTSDLPNGSYMIEIRIIDASGSVTIEERYYAKTANIPPADQPLYFLHVGQLENQLDTNRLSRTGNNELLVRGGFNKRLGQTLGGSIGFSVVEDTQFLELGLFRQGQNFEFQANAAYENTGATGVDMRLRYRHPLYSLIVNGRQVFSGLEDSQVGQSYQQYNGMVEVPLRNGFLSVFHRHVERPLSGRNLNTGVRYRTRNMDLPGGIFSSNFELSKNDDEVLALWTFSWFMQGNNRTSLYTPTVALANSKSSRDSGLYGSYETNWFRGQDSGNEFVYGLRGNYDSQSSLEARMEADTRRGSADITGRYNDASNNVEFSGRLSTSIATTGQGGAIGGKRRSESAFLVRVEGDIAADARFNVLVNGTVRGQLGADETLLVPVSPYNTYDVDLQAVGNTLVNLENRTYRETMYPGNVVNLSWRSRIINIAIGRLVDAAGAPLANAVIQNVVGIAMTDADGWFQAEVDQDMTQLRVQKGTTTCVAGFENPGKATTVLPLGTLTCN